MNLALWAAKTGLDAQNTRMSVIANNLANTNTTGFKAGRAAFQDLMYQNVRQVGAQSTQNTQYSTGLTLGTGVRIVATEKDYTQGAVNQTNSPLDMSVTGRGFLQITMPDGTIAYTRDGTFSLDNQGNMVTAAGYPDFYAEYHPLCGSGMYGHFVSILCHGIFERFPNTKVMMVEGGLVPFVGLLVIMAILAFSDWPAGISSPLNSCSGVVKYQPTVEETFWISVMGILTT